MQRWDEWRRKRLRVYIWKQWKVPKARIRNLMKLGIPKYYAHKWGYIKAYWNVVWSPVLTRSITNERLARVGYYSILTRYESLHLCDWTAVYGTVRTVVWEVGANRPSYSIGTSLQPLFTVCGRICSASDQMLSQKEEFAVRIPQDMLFPLF